MSSLAIYLNDLGHEVCGSDTNEYFYTENELRNRSIEIHDYDASNVTNDYIYIIGLSINKENEEFSEILNRNLEYYFYNEFISEFIDKKIIAVSGTHGKTTTAHIMKELSNCSCIIGCGEGLGNDSEYLILEACEYKNTFLSYSPELLVIQNMDFDHPDFFKNQMQVINSFQQMANRANKVLINGDLKDSDKIVHKCKITYGFNEKNDYRIIIISTNESGYTILLKGNNLCRMLKCNLFGVHNIYNYVGAYLSCILLDIKIYHKGKLTLPSRRMTKYKYGNAILIDDYAHHPTAINALYSSLKLEYRNIPINVIFQSHTYSRTLQFKKDFKKALKKFNKVFLLDVFPSAREKYDFKLQRKVDFYFRTFKKFNINDFKLIDKNEEKVWVFLGAGRSNEIIELLQNENDDVMKI